MISDDDLQESSSQDWDELSVRLERNSVYVFQLNYASETLRRHSSYWSKAAWLCLMVAVCYMLLAFASFGVITFEPSWVNTGLVQTYTVQTIITTMLVLAVSATVACFSRSLTLSLLADEANRASRAGDYVGMAFKRDWDHSDKGFAP